MSDCLVDSVRLHNKYEFGWMTVTKDETAGEFEVVTEKANKLELLSVWMDE